MFSFDHFFTNIFFLSKLIIILQNHNNAWQTGIVQLHEENQSFLQIKRFDWENGVTINYKDKTK